MKIRRLVIQTLCLLSLWLGVGLQAQAQADKVTYVYTDPQGTPLVEADASGNVIARYDYTPYGSAVASLGSAPNGPGYTGHVNDPESGFVYMQARYYDPAVGRFLSVDPVGPSAGGMFNFNRYAYASNNPVTHTDPDGRQDAPDLPPPPPPSLWDKIVSGASNWLNQTAKDGNTLAGGNPNATMGNSLGALARTAITFSPLMLEGGAARVATTGAEATAFSSSTALSTLRLTQEGETFTRYESADSAFSHITDSGVTPQTYAAPTSDGLVPVENRASVYNLPDPQIPRSNVFTLSPPAGTPVIGPRPVMGGTGNEVLFPYGY